MALQTNQVAVGVAPVELTVIDEGGSAIVVTAPDTAAMYVGPSSVTTTTGFRIPAGMSLTLDLTGERLYGVLASGTGTAYVLRTGV